MNDDPPCWRGLEGVGVEKLFLSVRLSLEAIGWGKEDDDVVD
jgi:hypothetical protein